MKLSFIHYFFIMISTQLLDSALTKELGSFFSIQAHKDSDRIRYINSAVRDICISKNFSFNRYKYNITTVSGNTDYVIPFQIETFGILNSTGDEVPFYDFDQYYFQKNKSGMVGVWDTSFISQDIGTFTILYRGFPESITNLNGTVNVPDHFYDLLLVKSVSYAFADIKDYVKQAQKNEIYNGMIKSMANRNTNRYPRQINQMGSEGVGGWMT